MGRSKNKSGVVELDGTTLEGGGQLIRIALCLAALTGRAVQIDKIRGKRSSGGGLKAQHLACVNWLAQASRASLEGAEKGSKILLFEPTPSAELSPVYKKILPKDGADHYACRLDIGTAGSTGLALQAILPYILFAPPRSQGGDELFDNLPVHLTVSGGTNVSGSPSYEYIAQVLLPTLEQIGFPSIKATLEARGWSQGGTSIGNFTLEIPPPSPLTRKAHAAFSLWWNDRPSWESSEPDNIVATFIGPVAVHEHFREVLTSAVSRQFFKGLDVDSKLSINCEDSKHDKRLYLILVATIPNDGGAKTHKLGCDWLYDRKIRSTERAATEMAERVAKDLVEEWESGAWVDEHMRDQLAIFQALSEGQSKVFPGTEHGELRQSSLHAQTAEWVCKEMLGTKFGADGVCKGVGFVAVEKVGSIVDESKASRSTNASTSAEDGLIEHTKDLSLQQPMLSTLLRGQ